MDVLSTLLSRSAAYLAHYDETAIEPPLSEWPALISQAPAAPSSTAAISISGDLRTRARRELQELVGSLQEEHRAALAAFGSSVQPPAWKLKTPLIIAGHQPVLYHPGILLKTLLARDLAAVLGGTAINLAIDTDEGDCGALSFPLSATGGLRRESTSLSGSPGVFFAQQLAEPEQLQHSTRRLSTALGQMGRDSSGVARAMELYLRAASTRPGERSLPLPTLNCLARALLTGTLMVPEVPLSALSRIPAVLEFFRQCVQQSDTLVPQYNETLAAFRTERKIKNPANPFPSLAISDGRTELPFWIVDPGRPSREVAHLADGDHATVCGSSGARFRLEELSSGGPDAPFLAPRGMLITTTFRVLFADLFIHGLGGGKYDRCTDIFIRDTFGLAPSPFTVASGTVRLFRPEVARYDELKALFESLRSLRANIPLLLEKIAFDSDQAAELHKLQGEKEDLLHRLQEKKRAGQSAKDEGIALKEIEQAVEELVNERLEVERTELELVDEESVAVLKEREYPYFLFPQLFSER